MLRGSNYEVGQIILEKGGQIVYRCDDRSGAQPQPILVKALRTEWSSYEAIMQYKREFNLFAELSPKVGSVPRPVRLEELGGLFLMVLEDRGGQPLSVLMEEKTLSYEARMRLAERIVECVGALHDQQVIHRNLNPAALLYNMETETVQLTDLALAVKHVQEKKAFRNAGHLEGTLPYISPEQTGRINRSIDYRSDFYSLGVLFYELFTGTCPHEAETVTEQLYAIIAKQPVPPHELRPDEVPRPLSDLIMKLLEKAPEDRYRTAYGILADLRKCRNGQDAFQMGEEDRLRLFRLPQKLYGREQELAGLQAVVRSLGSGADRERGRLVLIAGEAGIGKTALVQELHGFVSQEHGYFIQGKFDQYNQNLPFSAWIQAFRSLVAQLLNGDADELAPIRESLSDRLGHNASLLANLIPELQTLIGERPALEPLNPAEETNRFFMTFELFIEGLTRGETPLVLFLDDWQWADRSSIQLLDKLAGAAGLGTLLVIGAYRDAEITPDHPFLPALTQLEKRKEVLTIRPAPLSEEAIRRLIQDAVGSSPEWTGELGKVVHLKTRGNPLFVSEMLKDLHRQGAVSFDERHMSWRLDKAKLRELTWGEGDVSLLVRKIRTLPEEAQLILSLSASIGTLFDWKMLSLVSEGDSRSLAHSLIRGVQEDVIVPLHPNYHVLAGMHEEPQADFGSLELQFAFQHDKLQQALYQLIEPAARRRLHLRIGWLLLEHLPPREAEDKIIEIASNLNKGLEFISGEDEIDKLIEVNRKAAKKAKEGFGYETAFEFLEVALRMLPPDAWQVSFPQTLELYRMYAECSYLTHRVEKAEAACEQLLQFLDEPLELAAIYEMQANHYTYLGLMKRSLEAGKLGLRSLGLRVPERVGFAAVLGELSKLKWSLRGRTTEELLESPTMQDKRLKLIMRLLVGFIPPAFISGEKNLFAWVVLKKAYLSAKHGNGPESAGAYIGYAILLSGLGDLAGARDFGRLAVRINERFGDLQWRSLVLVLYTLFAHSWSESWNTLEEWYGRAIESSQKSGDLLYLAHACYYRHLWNPSMPIERYLQESVWSISMIENTQYKESLWTAKLSRQMFRALSGELGDPLILDDATFREAEFLGQLTEAKYFSGIAIYYVVKIQLLFTFEKHEEALAYIDKSYDYIGTLAGSAFMEQFSLYTYLSLATSCDRMSGLSKWRARRRMRTEYNRMRKWARHNPDTFGTQHLLMQAERARIRGDYETADACYNRAVQSSNQGGFIRYKALAHELAGKYYAGRKHSEVAAYFFRQAVYYYSVWGAKGKVQQLEQRYGERHKLAYRMAAPAESASAATSENLDVHAILAASQAISKEIGLDPLLDALMEIVIINAGAQRGCIVMKSSSTTIVEGEYDPETDSITVRKHDNAATAPYPKTLIDTVAERKETLICDDAVKEAMYRHDAYLARHKPKSLLCMPLMNQQQVTAIIYLENNLVAGAFTKERLKMIDLLSREMVYSLENASLYSNLERLVAERTEELAFKNQQLNKYIDIVDKNVMSLMIDVNGIVTDVSEEFCQSTGYRKEELIGRSHSLLQATDAIDGGLAEFRLNRAAAESGWRGELVQRTVDGSVLWLDMAMEPTIEQGWVTGYTFIGHNITDKKRIEQHSVTDDLTGLYNRRHFKDVFRREVKRSARNRDSLSFILLDIDYYKRYNDTYGHFEGDQVLVTIGETINAQLRRATDFAFRLGGEEFGILFSGATPEQSYGFAEKIRRSIEELRIRHEQSDHSPYVTVSVGLAVIRDEVTLLSEDTIYKLADEALYGAKADGRNCVKMQVV
ncbi:diguanylate cyclase [Paenibacillus sp. HJGM_3]|uniref:diguanylate cyclase n=1 Tax=Paenibacillus sp. HJGM_3 TaxID=3379816 RepID=UPI00385A61EB